MAGAFKSFTAFIENTSEVGADGRNGFDPFMIPVNEEVVFRQEGEGVHRESPRIAQSNPPPFTQAAGKELTEVQCRCGHSCDCGQRKGDPTDKMPAIHGLEV
jgi:hypothetical protein